MKNIDLEKIVSNYELIEEAEEVVGIWEFWIKDCPIKLKIKVIESYVNPEFPYTGIANYSIQCSASGAEAPYRSIHVNSSIEKAIKEALDGFFHFYKPELIDQTSFILDAKW